MNKIPKIIHQIWIGEEMPDKLKGFTDKMKSEHPDYEYYLWGNELWKKYADDPFIDSYKDKGFPLAFVTDRFRMLLLNEYGGIAVDPDCEIIRSFDNILNKLSKDIVYFCPARKKIDSGALFECGIQGSTPGSRIVKELLKVWNRFGLNYAPGGLRTSNKLIEIFDTDIAILGHEYFFTYEVNNKTILLHEPHTLDSWRKPEQKRIMQNRRAVTVKKLENEIVNFT